MSKTDAKVALDLVSGSIGGAAMTLCGHPFDTIKVKLQSQGTGPRYNGALDATKTTFVKEGFVGFYRGLGPPLATVAAFNAVLFSSRGFAERLLRHEDGSPLTLWDKTLAGGFAGVAVSFVATPTELLKCRLQAQGSVATATARLVASGVDPATVKIYRGPMDVARHVVSTEGGLFGLYRGLWSTILREVPGNMAMFGCYEGAKSYFAHLKGLEDTSQLDRLSQATAGGIGGAAFWLLCYPFDIIKSKIQVDNVHQPTYSGIYDCAKKTLEWEGVQGLYRGFSPCMVRSVIANATCFVVYEWASGFLTKHFQTRLPSRELTSTETS